MTGAATDDGGTTSWQVATQAGARAVGVVAEPGMGLLPLDGGWRTTGVNASFRLLRGDAPLALPAGWYELHGRLPATDGKVLMPCLYPTYAQACDGDTQIPLPDPAADGTLNALVLLKYDVAGLRFCPSFTTAQFRMEGFRLSRVFRARALRHMLDTGGGAARRLAGGLSGFSRFVLLAAREGVSRATERAFADYRGRLQLRAMSSYEAWSGRFDTFDDGQLAVLRERGRALAADGPLISVLLPVYQTPERWLRRCIDSVIAQAYPNWQLCIADDASPDPGVMRVLEEYARGDDRITVVRREVNGHISAASNSALGLARGDCVALLDHDDELRPHALLEMAEAFRDPRVALAYSDEDKIDADGCRFDPYFKPDFDPELLCSQNYVCHFTCIRTALVREVGGFREGFEGSQDHDLVLRCSERLQPGQVRHVPKVLYHWRAIPGSTALTRDAKDYASSAGARAVDEHLRRCHPGARAEELSHGHYRVRWPMPEPAPKVSLIVPTRDKVELLRMCVESILQRTTYPDFEIVVVDNQSSDAAALDYLASLEQAPRVRVLRHDAPFNYSAINNWAVGQCDGAVIGLVNNDIEVISPDWLEEMVSQAMRPGVGAVGAMLYYPDDTIQHAGVVLGVHGVAAHLYAGMPRGYPGHGGRARVAQAMSAVTGACLLVRRDRYEQVGGLDESLRVAFNDIDFCLRLREAGYRNIWTPFAELYHHESASRGVEDTEEKKQRFAGEVALMQRRWGGRLACDPAYNPNLSLASLCCELASPPRLAG